MKIIGYIVLIVSQFAIMTGVFDFHNADMRRSIVGIMDVVVFTVVWGVCEIIYQVHKRRFEYYKRPDRLITIEEFEILILKGEKLCILDDMVLDVSEFAQYHVGG